MAPNEKKAIGNTYTKTIRCSIKHLYSNFYDLLIATQLKTVESKGSSNQFPLYMYVVSGSLALSVAINVLIIIRLVISFLHCIVM